MAGKYESLEILPITDFDPVFDRPPAEILADAPTTPDPELGVISNHYGPDWLIHSREDHPNGKYSFYLVNFGTEKEPDMGIIDFHDRQTTR